MWRSRRFTSVIMKLMPKNTTHTTAIIRSMGQISSAYSFDWVNPKGRVSAAHTMIVCHPQKWRLLSRSDHILALHSRCVL